MCEVASFPGLAVCACNKKFWANVVLQVPNTQGLETRLCVRHVCESVCGKGEGGEWYVDGG